MKLVIAIVSRDDEQSILTEMSEKDFRATKIASTGGFLKTGNSTFISGVEDERVEELLELIKAHCSKRQVLQPEQIVPPHIPAVSIPYVHPVTIGGATVFIVSVEDYRQL